MKDKSKKPLVIVAIAFTAILLIGMIAGRQSKSEYELTLQETLDLVAVPDDYTVVPEDVAYYIDLGEPGYVYVDLRSPYDFVKGHLPGAVNIPENMLLEEEAREFFREAAEDSLTVVLYSTDEAAAVNPWMLLSQMGYRHLKVMRGGWDYYANEPLDPYDMPEVPKYMVEEPAYDFVTIMERLEANPGSVAAPEAQEVVIPARRKKKSAVEGGC
ncbi:MAG: rhodanese-like domain-containing protein [Bacteroidota bacterium]